MIVHNRAELNNLGNTISANTLVSVQRSVNGHTQGSVQQMPFSAVDDWMRSQGLTFRQTNLDITTVTQRGGLGLDYNLNLGQYVPSGLPSTAYGIAQAYPLTTAAVGAAAMGYHPMDYAENLLDPLNMNVPSFDELLGLPVKTLRQLASNLNIPGRSNMNKQQLAGSLRSAWR
jgi:hypothetical protein